MKQIAVLFSLIAIIGCSVLFFSMNKSQAKLEYITEDVSYELLEEAILARYEPTQSLMLYQSGYKDENVLYVLYSIDQDQLLTELFYHSENGFQRIKDSRLIIGGTSVKEADYKIRTFLISEGPWVLNNAPFTFVTFGHINKPHIVESVEIRYEGQYKKVDLENQTFFTIATSEVQWDTLHPVVFYDKDKDDVGGYMKDMLFANAYCH